MFINFKEIPGNTKLFLDYLYDFDKVKGFYKYNFRDKEQFSVKFKQLCESPKEFRNELSAIINNQYKSLSPSSKTLKNISLLKSKETIGVVTGQQLGILGGPLYTFYKIITAIKLCSHLSERYDQYQFVPVFWLEGDDHDFDEICSFNLIDSKNDPISINYDDGLPSEENRGSVGNIEFGENLKDVFKQLEKELRDTEYKSDIINLLSRHYKEGATFKDAFRNLLFEFFDEEGLIIFDPGNKEIKKLLSPIFLKEIEDFRDHTASVVERSAELEDTFHTQVKVKPINLFLSDDN